VAVGWCMVHAEEEEETATRGWKRSLRIGEWGLQALCFELPACSFLSMLAVKQIGCQGLAPLWKMWPVPIGH